MVTIDLTQPVANAEALIWLLEDCDCWSGNLRTAVRSLSHAAQRVQDASIDRPAALAQPLTLQVLLSPATVEGGRAAFSWTLSTAGGYAQAAATVARVLQGIYLNTYDGMAGAGGEVALPQVLIDQQDELVTLAQQTGRAAMRELRKRQVACWVCLQARLGQVLSELGVDLRARALAGMQLGWDTMRCNTNKGKTIGTTPDCEIFIRLDTSLPDGFDVIFTTGRRNTADLVPAKGGQPRTDGRLRYALPSVAKGNFISVSINEDIVKYAGLQIFPHPKDDDHRNTSLTYNKTLRL